jgi:hypothetical protein
MKEKLERIQMADENQFLQSLQEILSGIDEEESNGAFQVWVGRIQEVRQGNEDYVK